MLIIISTALGWNSQVKPNTWIFSTVNTQFVARRIKQEMEAGSWWAQVCKDSHRRSFENQKAIFGWVNFPPWRAWLYSYCFLAAWSTPEMGRKNPRNILGFCLFVLCFYLCSTLLIMSRREYKWIKLWGLRSTWWNFGVRVSLRLPIDPIWKSGRSWS